MNLRTDVRLLILTTVFVAFTSGDSGLIAWEWPAPDSTLRAGFLSLERGVPSRGIVFEATDEPFRAAHAGTIVFRGTYDRFAPGFVQPQGGYLAVDHGNGFTALYTNLETGTSGNEIRMQDILGRNVGEPVSFAVFDARVGVYANPLDLLPRRWNPDPPRVTSVFFSQDTNRISAGPRVSLDRGPATVSASVQSRLIPGANAVIPARVEYAVGSHVHHIMDLEQLVPGVLALGRQPEEQSAPADSPDQPPPDISTVDTSLDVPSVIDESQVPGIAVTGTVEPTASDGRNFRSAAENDEGRGIDGSSDLIVWPGGFRLASHLYDSEGSLRLGVIEIDSRSINTGVILYDATGNRVRRNISIDPVSGE